MFIYKDRILRKFSLINFCFIQIVHKVRLMFVGNYYYYNSNNNDKDFMANNYSFIK